MFEKQLKQFEKLGFYGIELNLANLEIITPVDLKRLLEEYNLKISYFATGLYGRLRGYSLSSDSEELRKKSVRGLLRQMEYASQIGSGVIVGFMKGNPSLTGRDGWKRLKMSLDEVAGAGAVILLEATCHYETSLILTVKDAVEMIKVLEKPESFYVLPDTCCMNMEECDMFYALRSIAGRYRNIHFSDSNACFPGLGGINFSAVINVLRETGYVGTVCLEAGCFRQGMMEDLTESVRYLEQIVKA